ncbi:protein O-mannosyl-transferase 2-like [Octopus sinensis]|uniref:Protein O-mannosyl-transferase 2 n=1 Tax=Octopus sinensis TaxID=2607531 RepID=A0A6P7SRG3_9MOLL|nr:protein O-mannosyl-transferase 2-like [Octopus sinensis]
MNEDINVDTDLCNRFRYQNRQLDNLTANEYLAFKKNYEENFKEQHPVDGAEDGYKLTTDGEIYEHKKYAQNDVTTSNEISSEYFAKENGNVTNKTKKEISSQKPPENEISPLPYNRRLFISCLSLLTLISLLSRLYKIEEPPHVCWDETHFGKMASWYIQRTFFFDVHPPLGKMLIAFSGLLTGYDGNFPFAKPGDEYEDTQYVGMRIFCALLGTAIIPISFLIVWELTKSIIASFLAGLIILADTGILTLSRHILLDPILLFFIMMSTYSILKFVSLRQKSFTLQWWFWLSTTGIFLAFSIGVKFVGLFVILLAGYTTAKDLWDILGDTSIPLVLFIRHFIARSLCLIILPIFIYMLIFCVHFKILHKSGNGDGFYSSAFQSQLIGNKLYNVSMPENVAYGSIISLKQKRAGGAYLHSHHHLYPEEHPPRQQQVTTYSHKDENNLWKIKYPEREAPFSTSPQILKNGDLIRLEHVITRRNLHSHQEVAPITQRHYQVTGYGQDGVGDGNDMWIVEIVGVSDRNSVQTVRSKVRLIHYYMRCALQSHDKRLPKWGWEQLEVTCNPNIKDPKTLWSVEEVWDSRLPNVSFEVYSPNFLEKFIESHVVMTQGNSGLKPSEGELTSRPWQWPIDYKGQTFSGKDHRIYLLGNPVVFWGNIAVFVLFLIIYIVYVIRHQRDPTYQEKLISFNQRTFNSCWWLILGWALHYFPFWGMSRVLYFHHYFPAFLFNAMFTAIILDYLITHITLSFPEHLATTFYHWSLGLVISCLGFSFYLFAPLAYGMSGPEAADESSKMHKLKWLNSWEI